MSKAEEISGTYALHKASEKLHDYYGNSMLSVVQFDGYDIKNAYIEGYHQAERNLELTWEDVNDIIKIYEDVLEIESGKNIYIEVLNRFNKYKKR